MVRAVYYAAAGHRVATLFRRRGQISSDQLFSLAVTVGIIAGGIVLTLLFQDDLSRVGEHLVATAGQNTVDAALFSATAVSSTLLTLPVWGYVPISLAMGYGVWHLAVVMAVGSATGSFSTMLVGRYLGQRPLIRRRFPALESHPWTQGRSRNMVTLFLFLGTASPIPCDVFYLACGAKHYPMTRFWLAAVAGRIVRYVYLGYGIHLII